MPFVLRPVVGSLFFFLVVSTGSASSPKKLLSFPSSSVFAYYISLAFNHGYGQLVYVITLPVFAM